MGETHQLAAFAAGSKLERYSAPVIVQAKRCILETLGCALAGSRTPLVRAAAQAIKRQGEGGLLYAPSIN